MKTTNSTSESATLRFQNNFSAYVDANQYHLSYFFGPGADSIQIDKIQYPDRKVVERCAMIRDFGDKTKEVL